MCLLFAGGQRGYARSCQKLPWEVGAILDLGRRSTSSLIHGIFEEIVDFDYGTEVELAPMNLYAHLHAPSLSIFGEVQSKESNSVCIFAEIVWVRWLNVISIQRHEEVAS